jgi:hypothetical protein
MAMWFSHLRYVEAAAARLDTPIDRLSSCWGSLCCDVDKVSSVEREVSHYGREGLNFQPEEFLEQAGLTPADARTSASFLVGYLSHMAVDEAWYGHLFRLRDARPELQAIWTYHTTRALNLSLDQRNRAHYDPTGLDFSVATGEHVLPHLRGPIRALMIQAASAYVSWPGHMAWRTDDSMLGPVMDSFRALAASERERVELIERELDADQLDEDVIAFVTDVMGRFLDDLAARPG